MYGNSPFTFQWKFSKDTTCVQRLVYSEGIMILVRYLLYFSRYKINTLVQIYKNVLNIEGGLEIEF